MSAITIALIVFACVFGGALVGMCLRGVLPDHHLSGESRDIVKAGMGLVGTMTALLLGLLVASAKSSYDSEKSEITQMAADIDFLDRLLVGFGPETREARDLLRQSVAMATGRMWPEVRSRSAELDPNTTGTDALFRSIAQLTPNGDLQQSLKSQALSTAADLGHLRWLLFEQMGSSISHPMLVMVVFWLTIIFVSFGMLAPRNITVGITLFVCAFSVSGAIFLVLELDHPFSGMIRIPSDAMHKALTHLEQ